MHVLNVYVLTFNIWSFSACFAHSVNLLTISDNSGLNTAIFLGWRCLRRRQWVFIFFYVLAHVEERILYSLIKLTNFSLWRIIVVHTVEFLIWFWWYIRWSFCIMLLTYVMLIIIHINDTVTANSKIVLVFIYWRSLFQHVAACMRYELFVSEVSDIMPYLWYSVLRDGKSDFWPLSLISFLILFVNIVLLLCLFLSLIIFLFSSCLFLN